MSKSLDDFQNEQVTLLAKYHPYTTKDVEWVFKRCRMSFDKTVTALQYGNAYNSIERGIHRALQDEAGGKGE